MNDKIYEFIKIEDDITSIKRLKENYPKIEEGIFNEILKVDPTYKDNPNESGKYTNWILSLFNQGNLKQEDFYKVKQYLEKFIKYKTKIKNRDINSYRTLPDLAKAIEEAESLSPTKSEIKRTVQNVDLDKDAKLYMSTENFDIYIPLTYEASCKLGSNTEWCTATRETREYYDDYTYGGYYLYIMINKNDKSEKYQYNDKEDYTCDRYDEQIEAIDLCVKHEDLIEFYNQYIYKLEEKVQEAKEYLNGKNFVYTYGKVDTGLLKCIKKVKIDDDVENIEAGAFANCTSLQSVDISKSVLVIEDDAFAKCTSLQSIVIPSNVYYIGNFAFARCLGLKEVTMNADISKIQRNTFFECSSLQNIVIPSKVTEIGQCAFKFCKSLKSIKIPSSVTKIGQQAFAYCVSLQSINIPSSVTYIGHNAFDGCGSLQSITIPSSVKKIDAGAFDECQSLTIYTSIPREEFREFDGWRYDLKIVYQNQSQHDSKEDWENFKSSFGEELYNRYLKLRPRLTGELKDIYYIMRNYDRYLLKEALDKVEYYGYPILTENEDYVVFYLDDVKMVNKLCSDTSWCIKKTNVFNAYKEDGVENYLFINKSDPHIKYCVTLMRGRFPTITDWNNDEVDEIPNQPLINGQKFHNTGHPGLREMLDDMVNNWPLDRLEFLFSGLGEFDSKEELRALFNSKEDKVLANYLDDTIDLFRQSRKDFR